MELMKRAVYVLLWLAHDKSGEYRPRSCIPKHEIEAIVRAFYPAVVAFFESEEASVSLKNGRQKKRQRSLLRQKQLKQKTCAAYSDTGIHRNAYSSMTVLE